jgi:hypothetical protein
MSESKKVDYKAEIAKAKAKMERKLVNAIVLSPSGGGKSALAGTFGVPTLYLFASSEEHGPESASAFANCEITPICIDADRTPDQAIEFLIEILSNKDFLKDFEAIVVDGATALEILIRETNRFKIACMTDKGKHSSYAEGPAALSVFNEILGLLRASDKHTLMTCILDVREVDAETGEILDSSPRLGTYSLAEGIVLQHPDVFIIGPLTKDDKTAHRIQFAARMNKTSKEASGKVKKLLNFTPRITGVKDLPNSLPPKLSEVIKLKRGEKK